MHLAANMMLRRWLFLIASILPLCYPATLFDDYTACKTSGELGNGTLVCDPEGKLQPNAVQQLNAMLTDLERNVECECADGCGGRPYATRLLVTSEESIEQSGGMDALNGTAKRIWTDAGMGDNGCDNGMLLIYLRDQKKMVTYQGPQRFRLYTDQEIADLHEAVMRANGTGTVAALPIRAASEAAEVQRAGDDSLAPIVGLSIALALTFLVMAILLIVLLAKCCRLCCCRGAARKGSSYQVNPLMPSYKSIEPIYIVTPMASEYGTTASYPRHGMSPAHRAAPPPPSPMMMFGHPPPQPPGPLIQHPRSRSTTPTSTHRIRRHHHSGGMVMSRAMGPPPPVPQSMQSTPEPNKRDKVNRMSTIRSDGTYYSAMNPDSSPEGSAGPSSAAKKLSYPTIREGELLREAEANQQFAFLDPKRKQEVQTREEFIG